MMLIRLLSSKSVTGKQHCLQPVVQSSLYKFSASRHHSILAACNGNGSSYIKQPVALTSYRRSEQAQFSPLTFNVRFLSGSASRAASGDAVTDAANAASSSSAGLFVPAPPQVNISDLASQLATEPTFTELGIGAVWSPAGIVQLGVEWVHNLGLPWWGAVMLLTFTIRAVLFPVYVKSRRAMINLQNGAPRIQELNERFTRARAGGNALETTLLAHELSKEMQSRTNWQAYLMILVQAPTFLVVFTALRGMCAAGVPSLQTGGLYWFTDLSVPDPYYVLPVLTALTLLVTFELGAEGISSSMWKGNKAKWILRMFALCLIPTTSFFPACMCLYWLTNNMISLGLSRVLSTEGGRRVLSLPEIDKSLLGARDAQKTAGKGFFASVRETYQNASVGSALVNRTRNSENEWRDAALKPAVRTYSDNPLLRRNSAQNSSKRSVHTVVTRPFFADR